MTVIVLRLNFTTNLLPSLLPGDVGRVGACSGGEVLLRLLDGEGVERDGRGGALGVLREHGQHVRPARLQPGHVEAGLV